MLPLPVAWCEHTGFHPTSKDTIGSPLVSRIQREDTNMYNIEAIHKYIINNYDFIIKSTVFAPRGNFLRLQRAHGQKWVGNCAEEGFSTLRFTMLHHLLLQGHVGVNQVPQCWCFVTFLMLCSIWDMATLLESRMQEICARCNRHSWMLKWQEMLDSYLNCSLLHRYNDLYSINGLI